MMMMVIYADHWMMMMMMMMTMMMISGILACDAIVSSATCHVAICQRGK